MTKPFKSERAAKMAFTKAMNAHDAKEVESHRARDEYRAAGSAGSLDGAEYDRLLGIELDAKAAAEALYEEMRAIYTQACSQGWIYLNWHSNWYFGSNATRDLIAANMD